MIHYKKIALLAICSIVVFASCKKYDGDSYDFSDKVKHYIQFTPGQDLVINGNTADSVIGTDTFYYYVEEVSEFAVETRVAFTEDIQFTYTVTTNDGNVEEHTGTLAAGESEVLLEIAYPEAAFPSGTTEITGEIDLIKASGGKYGDLRLGYPQEGDNLKIGFVANKPNVLYPYE